ncbi:MAG: hypothetical protein U9N52_08055 [Campylobacterota bacterium]|nr:hypothetical protein [Campylobacterota bacterium]
MKRQNSNQRSKFTALENHFLNTFFSGLYLSQNDLIAIAKKVDIELDMNTREMLIKNLLNESDRKGNISQVTVLLNQLIDQRIQAYHKLSIDYPASQTIMATLAQKANGTKSLLARESRANPYE